MLKYLGYYAIFLVFITFVFSLLNIFGLDNTVTNLLLFIFNFLVFFIFGYKSGELAKNKGYLQGLKISLLFLIFLIIINIIIGTFNAILPTLIYYLLLVLSSTIGAMIGINKKEDTN